MGRTTLPIASISCPTPVLLSESVLKRATASGCSSKSFATASAENASPQGTSWRTTSIPNVSQSSRHRSENFPDSNTIAFPPWGTTLTTAASIAPVPELVSTSTSFAVWNTYFSPSRTSRKRVRNSSVRWWRIG